MTTTNDMEKTIHQGRNIKRFREMLGIKQEGLASELGDDWNQKKISLLEQKEVVEDTLLGQVAKALKIPVDAFKNFDEEAAVNFISSTFNDQSVGYVGTYNFNPLDKMVELYERMLKEKNDLIEKLEKSGKKN